MKKINQSKGMERNRARCNIDRGNIDKAWRVKPHCQGLNPSSAFYIQLYSLRLVKLSVLQLLFVSNADIDENKNINLMGLL